MLFRIDHFVSRVEHNLNGFIDELRAVTGRYGEVKGASRARSTLVRLEGRGPGMFLGQGRRG